MAQNTVLAAGATTATSSPDTTVAAGSVASVGIFRDAGEITDRARAEVLMDTPGADVVVAVLDKSNPVTVIVGPGVFRVKRVGNSSGENYGIFTQD